MVADGRADPAELKLLHDIAHGLGLDLDVYERMKDRAIVGLGKSTLDPTGLPELLGFAADWPSEKLRDHLSRLFGKWNARIGSLPPGEEREKAQEMLDLVAAARSQYVQ